MVLNGFQQWFRSLILHRHGFEYWSLPGCLFDLGVLLHPNPNLGDQCISTRSIRLVDDIEICDLHDSSLHALDGISQARSQYHNGGVSGLGYLHFILAHTHGLNDNPVFAETVHDFDHVRCGSVKPAEVSAGGHRADKNIRIPGGPLHTDPITEKGATSERTGGVHGYNAHGLLLLAKHRRDLVGKGTLARAGGAGYTQHMRSPRMRIN